ADDDVVRRWVDADARWRAHDGDGRCADHRVAPGIDLGDALLGRVENENPVGDFVERKRRRLASDLDARLDVVRGGIASIDPGPGLDGRAAILAIREVALGRGVLALARLAIEIGGKHQQDLSAGEYRRLPKLVVEADRKRVLGRAGGAQSQVLAGAKLSLRGK